MSKAITELLKGAWSAIITYSIGDIVISNGSSYICIGNHTNHVPPNATYWALLASKGTDGTNGVDGNVTLTTPQTLSGPKTLTDPILNGSVAGTVIDTDTALAANSDVKLASQKAIKTYSDNVWKNYLTVIPTSGTLDDPSFQVVFAGVNLTSFLSVGMKIRLTQGNVKYFIITKIAFSTDTTITLYGGTDYDLVATGTTAITAFAYSTEKTPFGFNIDPTKWTETFADTSDRTVSSPGDGTWVNPGTSKLSMPIGLWTTSYAVFALMNTSGDANITLSTALSTANNSASDAESVRSKTFAAPGSFTQVGESMIASKILTISAKADYFLNIKANASGVTSNVFKGSVQTTIIKAVCAYL